MDWTAFSFLCSSSPCQSMMAQKASSDSLWPGHLASFCRGCPAGIPSSLVPLDLLVSAGVVLELELDDEEGEGVFPFAVFGRCFVGFALDFGVVCKQLSLPSFLPSAGDESANRPRPRPPLPTLLVEEGLWSLCSGLFPAVFATCKVCSAMHPQNTPNSSPHPGLVPAPSTAYP